MRRLETHDWWSDLVALKDDLSLRELAEKFGVTAGAISAALKREGIGRTPAPPGPRAHRKKRGASIGEEELPPEPGEVPRTARRRIVRPDPARKAVESAGPPRPRARSGSKDTRILEFFDLLGKVPDRDVAEKANVSVRTLASFRARHGIAAYSGPRRKGKGRKRKSKIDPFAHLLGQAPDRVIADRAGVSLNAVRNYRVKHGIAAAPRAGRKEAVVKPTPAPSTPRLQGSQAWKVTIRVGNQQLERVVIADNLVDAAAAASDSGSKLKGEVVSVSWVGALL
jgi:hypothetical protein